MSSTDPQPIRLDEYTAPDFQVTTVALRFELGEHDCVVDAVMTLERRGPAGAPLILDGRELELIELGIDHAPLPEQRYRIEPGRLVIASVPDELTVSVKTRIYPQRNTSLEGLYRSGAMFCTQCEAQGFRKITYFPDRPDVMAKFTTTIVAEREPYPILLSNGNPVDAGILEDGRHWATWADPFPKPSYLFALVAGDLECHRDHFRTRSGREVALEIYVESHNIGKCGHAMTSLKRAMAWDEATYGLEYDLERYLIVAVDDFNMGAMENKGLNIFNSKYVLADPQSATDADYENIESVIAHEYFHNWTGNRVTCRDWFQLSLKEGLTVFRDQEFTSDVRSRAVKRIGDVRVLRTAQFTEDGGPMAHPVRPESYLEINNFYTVTVYNKGAEVVRMTRRLLGREKFRRAMDLYFDRFDGQAVTTDDFVAVMEAASGIDLGQFRRWYSQAGTPRVRASERFDPVQGTYELSLAQHCPPSADGSAKLPFHIPIEMGLLDETGRPIGTGTLVELTTERRTIVHRGLKSKPVASLLRGFSAPVRMEFERPDRELALLMRCDPDSFNRWDASQELAQRLMLKMINAGPGDRLPALEPSFVDAFRHSIRDPDLDKALLAEMLALPSESYLADQLPVIDVEAIHRVRQHTRQQLALALRDDFEWLYHSLRDNARYRFDTEPAARRACRNTALGYLMELDSAPRRARYMGRCLNQFRQADNMTDRLAALGAAARRDVEGREEILAEFAERWHDDRLVMDKWFAIQAAAPLADTLSQVERLLEHPAFDADNPNRIRALIGTFCHQNQLRFHDGSGAGYRFLGRQIERLDRRNPQVAARLAGAFGRWRRFDDARQVLMEAQMVRLSELEGLSTDCYEILSRALAAGRPIACAGEMT